MSIIYVSKVHFLTLKASEGILDNNLFNISSDKAAVLNHFDKDKIIPAIGTLAWDVLAGSQTLVYSLDSIAYDKNFTSNADVVSGQVFAILSGLWLVKDNSVYPGTFTFHNTETNNTITILRDVTISNSRGQYVYEEFNEEELLASQSLMTEIIPLLQISLDEKGEVVNDGVRVNRPNLLPHPDQRIKRAYLFLGEARTSTNVYKKVTYYVAMLEALFATEEINAETSRTVAKRALAFLHEDVGDKESFLNLIKHGYNVRSRYIHGDTINFTQEQVYEISNQIDSVLRLVFQKIIVGKHIPVFDGHRRALRKWLNELIEKHSL